MTSSPASPNSVPSPPSPSQEQLRGIVLISLAVLCFSVLDSLAKYLSGFYAVTSLVWVRYLVHTLLMAATLGPRMGLELIHTRRPWLQCLRASLLSCTTLLFISGLVYIPLAEATAIMYLTPLLVTVLSVPLLGERVESRNWLVVVLGFVGVLIIVRPGSALLTPAIVLPLLGALSNSAYQIATRKLGGTENPLATNFITGLVGTVLMSFAVLFTWTTPTPRHALLMVGMGAAGMCGHYLLIRAFQHASPAALAPFGYAQIAWAVLLGYLVFDALPDAGSLIGIAIIVICGLYIVLHRRPRKTSA